MGIVDLAMCRTLQIANNNPHIIVRRGRTSVSSHQISKMITACIHCVVLLMFVHLLHAQLTHEHLVINLITIVCYNSVASPVHNVWSWSVRVDQLVPVRLFLRLCKELCMQKKRLTDQSKTVFFVLSVIFFIKNMQKRSNLSTTMMQQVIWGRLTCSWVGEETLSTHDSHGGCCWEQTWLCFAVYQKSWQIWAHFNDCFVILASLNLLVF